VTIIATLQLVPVKFIQANHQQTISSFTNNGVYFYILSELLALVAEVVFTPEDLAKECEALSCHG
jgi:hypothetical protein